MAKKKVNKGVQVVDKCLEKAMDAINLFSQDELRDFVTDVFENARDNKILTKRSALAKAAKDISDKRIKTLINDCATTARNLKKFELATDKIKKGNTLRSLLIPTTKNKDYNIERSQYASRNELFNTFHKSLTKEEITFFEHASQETQEAIADVADGKTHENPIIRKLGEKLNKYTKERNARLVLSDALSYDELNNDRYLKAIHNPVLLSRGGDSLLKRVLSKNKVDTLTAKEKWVSDIKESLDLKKTAKNFSALDLEGNIIEAKLDQGIRTSYDNILQQKSDITTKSAVVNDRDALKRKRKMFFVFKDWRSQLDYNSKYGQGTLYQAVLSDINSSGNNIGTANIFGDNPVNMFNDLRDAQIKYSNPGILKIGEAEQLFKQVASIDKSAYSPTLANIRTSINAWSGIARLGSLVINSYSDISQVAALSQRFGYGFWKAYIDTIVHAFNLVKDEDRETIAKDMQMSLNAHMGYMGRFADAASFNDMASKMSSSFYWLNFMTAWDKGLKLSGMAQIGKGLGRDSFKAFEELNPQTRSQLSRFNINSDEWDALRSKSDKKLFTLSNIDKISDSELRDLYGKSDKLVPYSDYRNYLYRKVFSLFDCAVENSVLDPRTYERMVTSWGIRPGTPHGEFVNAIMQFKSYPIANFRRVWYGGMAEMDGAQAKVMYAFSLAAGTYMLSYLSSVMGDLVQNKTPRAPEDLSHTEQVALLAPGMGTFLKVLNKNNQDPAMLMSLFMTPTMHIISDPFVATAALATGNPKYAKRAAKDFVNYTNPIGTIPIAQPMFDSLFGNKPYMAPGQHKLIGG